VSRPTARNASARRTGLCRGSHADPVMNSEQPLRLPVAAAVVPAAAAAIAALVTIDGATAMTTSTGPRHTGIANLPLHGGKAPPWLFQRMVKLAREITIVIVSDFGPDEMLQRLSHPTGSRHSAACWVLIGIPAASPPRYAARSKKAFKGMEKDLGLFVAGGKGKTSRKTPSE